MTGRHPAAERFDLTRLLRPSSIAVVGASDRPGSYAAQALENLQTIGFPGQVWGVNPNRREAMGRPCFPTVADLPEAADAVVVAIPAAGVPAVVEQAGARGCGGAVVFSAGFAEVAAGVGRQRELTAAAERHSLPVCGPNCNGIVATHARTALWGDALGPPEPGSVALVSQSGNVAVNALATRRGLRFHTVIASGNQAVLSAADYLEFLAHEDGVRSIALYLEDDGGPRLCDGLAACADAGVHVAVLKVGSSIAGARAAAAHSAALAGDQRVFRALVLEAGAVWAQDVHELLELAKTLAVPRPSGPADARTDRARLVPERPRIAIMTCSGGDSAQGADEANSLGLELPALASATERRLAEILPSAATVGNPLDYTTMIWGDRDALGEIIAALGGDPAIEQVLIFYDQPHGLTGAGEASWRAVREGIVSGAALNPVDTIVCSTLPELLDDESAWRFAQSGVPAAAGLRTGLRCARARLAAGGDGRRLREIAASARRLRRFAGSGSQWLAEHDAKELLRAGGLSIPAGRVVGDGDDAAAALAELGGPIALKLSAAGVQHKSELGGVALGLRTEADVRAAYGPLAQLADAHRGAVLAEQMAEPGVELLVAARTDGVVPALVIGLGGIWTELLDDVAIVPLPAGAERIERAILTLRGAPLLAGARGRPAADVRAAARLAERAGELLVQERLETLECNPVLVGRRGAVAVDASVRRYAPSLEPAVAIAAQARAGACTT